MGEVLRGLTAALEAGVIVVDGDGYVVACDSHAAGLLGTTRDQIHGTTLSDAVGEEAAAVLRTAAEDPGRFRGGGRPSIGALRFNEPGDVAVLTGLKPLPGFPWRPRLPSGRREELRATVRALDEDILPAGERGPACAVSLNDPEAVRDLELRLAQMDRILKAVNEGSSLEDVFDQLVHALSGVLPFDRATVLLVDEEKETVTVRRAVSELPLLWTEGMTSPLTPARRAGLYANRIRVIENLVEYQRRHPQVDSIRLMVEEGMRSHLMVPLVAEGRAIGALTFAHRRENAYARVNEALTARMGTHLALVLAKNRLIEDLRDARSRLELRQRRLDLDLGIARQVQLSLIPRRWRRAPLTVAVAYQAMEKIGGDFAGIHPSRDGNLTLVICDVSGHGIAAALLAGRIHSEVMRLVRMLVSPRKLVRRLNNFAWRHFQDTGLFFSMACARINPERTRMEYCGAGHPSSLLAREDGTVEELESRHLLLGVDRSCLLTDDDVEVDLRSGDRLLLYTDGAIETMDENDRTLGREGLCDLLVENRAMPVPDLRTRLAQGVAEHRAGPARDDVSLLVAGLD